MKTCKDGGVNDIYISSLTCRPRYQEKLNSINRQSADRYDYYFIDNSNIKANHLWGDHLHLNDQGICILARNSVEIVNRMFIYNLSLALGSDTWV